MGVLRSAAVKKVWQTAEARMPKVIPAESHGLLDYLQAAAFLAAAAYVWKRERKAGIVSLAAGTFLLAEALLTDYPLGARPWLGFDTHGNLDRGFSAFAASAPKTMNFQSRGIARFYRANAWITGVVTAMTDFSRPHARLERGEVD
jgi:hypothetical protein